MAHHPPSPRYFIGMMSGTSLDGVDAVLVAADGHALQQVASHFLPYPDPLKQSLLALQHAGENELHLAAVLANELAALYATSVPPLLAQSGLQAAQITAIGCHGQTIRHCPTGPDQARYTLQLGNLARLAERTQITVVGDFRSRDLAAGGQGAPLVPAFHQAVFASVTQQRAILNIGGIANLSWLPTNGEVIGFDTGPGNMLLDHWVAQHTGQAYDAGGAWSATGTVDAHLLGRMLADPYFALPIPKSTGRDLFHADWLAAHLSGGSSRPQDVARTLLELTAVSIQQALQQHCAGVEALYVCGGGAHNALLMQRLSELTRCKVGTTDALGIGVDWVEAVAFAWLAQRCIDRQPGNLAQVTGASGPRILGAIYPA